MGAVRSRDGTRVWLLNEAAWGLFLQHPQFPAGLEVTDEVLEKAAGTDVNNMCQLTVEMFD